MSDLADLIWARELASVAVEAGKSGDSLAWFSAVDELLRELDQEVDEWTGHMVTCSSVREGIAWAVHCPDSHRHEGGICRLHSWLVDKVDLAHPVMSRAALDSVDFARASVSLVIR